MICERMCWKCVCGANLYIDSNGAPASKAEPVKQEPKKWVDLTNEEYEMLCQGNAPMNIRVRTVAMALKHKNQGD